MLTKINSEKSCFFYIDEVLFKEDQNLFDEIESSLIKIGLSKKRTPIDCDFVFYLHNNQIVHVEDLNKYYIKFINSEDFEISTQQIEKTFILQSSEDWNNLENFIKNFWDNWILSNKNLFLASSEEFFRKNKLSNLVDFNWEKINEADLDVFYLNSPEEIKESFNNNLFWNSNGFGILNFEELLELNHNQYLVFCAGEKSFFALSYQQETELLSVAFHFLLDSFNKFKVLDSNYIELEFWEMVFSYYTEPIVLLDKNNEIIFHNSKFVALNLSQSFCIDLENNQQIQIEGKSYKILRKNIEFNNETLIYFIPIQNKLIENNSSTEELGIVCSSLAHELNNPLAGILAAITVLEMEEVNSEIEERFHEMKSGVNRCKRLVETFLGFSRIDQYGHNQIENLNIKQSFDQALELMRFRMIESNMKFEIHYKVQNAFNVFHNSSVMAMLFYLLLGEIVTAFSHFILVCDSQNDRINLNVFENNNLIKIEWNENYSINDVVKNSKLIQHLIESQNANAETDNGILLKFS